MGRTNVLSISEPAVTDLILQAVHAVSPSPDVISH